MAFRIHLLQNDGTIITDGLLVDVIPTHISYTNPLSGQTTIYHVSRTLAPVSTAGGSTVRVYCEPTDPPSPHP